MTNLIIKNCRLQKKIKKWIPFKMSYIMYLKSFRNKQKRGKGNSPKGLDLGSPIKAQHYAFSEA